MGCSLAGLRFDEDNVTVAGKQKVGAAKMGLTEANFTVERTARWRTIHARRCPGTCTKVSFSGCMLKSCHFCVPWDADILDPDGFKPSFVSQPGNKHTLTCKSRNTEFGDRTISMPEWCPISLSVSQSLFRSCLWIIHVSSARKFISVAKDLPFGSHSSAQISRMLQKSPFSRRPLTTTSIGCHAYPYAVSSGSGLVPPLQRIFHGAGRHP